MTLLDTDVLIELRIGGEKARDFLQSFSEPSLMVSGIVAMEFLVGSRDRAELERSRRFVDSLHVLWPNEADTSLAYQLILEHRLSSGLGLGDYIIAAQCLNREANLLSFNLRHFGVVANLNVNAPYVR